MMAADKHRSGGTDTSRDQNVGRNRRAKRQNAIAFHHCCDGNQVAVHRNKDDKKKEVENLADNRRVRSGHRIHLCRKAETRAGCNLLTGHQHRREPDCQGQTGREADSDLDEDHRNTNGGRQQVHIHCRRQPDHWRAHAERHDDPYLQGKPARAEQWCREQEGTNTQTGDKILQKQCHHQLQIDARHLHHLRCRQSQHRSPSPPARSGRR